MTIAYDTFRTKTFAERVALFNALPAVEKAALVRTHMSRWLEAHRHALSVEQIEVVEDNIRFVRPELYASRHSERLAAELKQLELRTSAALSREQMREALTLHW